MNLTNLTIEELQALGRTGLKDALTELGTRVLDFEFCLISNHVGYCAHRHELSELKFELENGIPPECPHCRKWITDK